jgi:hypothetical protein
MYKKYFFQHAVLFLFITAISCGSAFAQTAAVEAKMFPPESCSSGNSLITWKTDLSSSKCVSEKDFMTTGFLDALQKANCASGQNLVLNSDKSGLECK